MDEELKILVQEANLSEEEIDLLQQLTRLKIKLSRRTIEKFRRLNPFYEDLFSWQARGALWTKGEKNITIYNSTTLSGDVQIGQHTWIGPFCSLDGGIVGLKIGEYCSISAACHILTHDTVKWAVSKGRVSYEYMPTSIGDGCFIGTSSVICKGVSLGDSCVVAAGSVITKSFQKNSIIGGVPAKQIGVVIDDGDDVVLKYS